MVRRPARRLLRAAVRLLLLLLLCGGGAEALCAPEPSAAAAAAAAPQQTKKRGTAKPASGSGAKKQAPANKNSSSKKTTKKGAKKGTTKKTSKKTSKKAPVRTGDEVKREQRDAAAQIKQTTDQLDRNKRSTAEQLTRLSDLRGQITEHNRVITSAQARASALEGRISSLNDTIALMQAEVERMRRAYAGMVSRSQGVERMTDKLVFLLSAETFETAVNRLAYLGRISRRRRERSEQLRRAVERLDGRQAQLAVALRDQHDNLTRMHSARAAAERDSRETARIVDDLKRQGDELRRHLAEQQARMAKLDRELDAIIAAEQRRREQEEQRRREQAAKAANKKSPSGKPGKGSKPSGSQTTPELREADPVVARQSGSFASLKGRLPFPVGGKYRIISRFGRQPHPDVPGVQVDNPGIDIELASGTSARAVASGTVSAVFRQADYQNIVMVRHGNYITIYAGLENLSVHKGQEVAAGQNLGTVRPSADRGGRRVLHFELRHEREKLNPLVWVKG